MRKFIGLMIAIMGLLPIGIVLAGDPPDLLPDTPIQAGIDERGERDVYRIEGTANTVIRIQATADEGSNLDTYLELFDPNGDLLAVNDDADPTTINSELESTLPEDGDYTAVVSAFGGASQGAYEIVLTIIEEGIAEPTDEPQATPEPTDEPAQTATPAPTQEPTPTEEQGQSMGTEPFSVEIAYGETVEATLEAGGTTRFTFVGSQGDVISVGTTGNFDGFLTLTDSAETVIAENDDDGTLLMPGLDAVVLPADDTYTLALRGFSGSDAGDFTLTLTVAGTASVDGQVLTVGEIQTGFITGTGDNRYTFTGDVGDVISVDIASDYDLVMELQDPSGSVIASDDDSGLGLNPLIRDLEITTAGEYTVVVTAFDDTQTGEYQILLTTLNLITPTDIAYADTLTGSIVPGDIAQYQFMAQQGDVISIAVDSNFDAYLQVATLEYQIVASDDDSAGNLQPLIDNFIVPEAGEYLILVDGYDRFQFGDYGLTLELQSTGAAIAEGEGELLVYGDQLSGILESGQTASFTFDGVRGDVVSVELDATFDGVMRLVDPNGQILAEDDDSGFGLNPFISEVSLPGDGQYTIEIASFDGLEAGSYTLTLRNEGTVVVDDDPPADTTSVNNGGSLVYGDTVQGNLAPAEIFTLVFDANAGDQITIDVSADFDAFLEIQDPAGTLIAADDDSGLGLNPALVDLPIDVSGTHTILLSAFDPGAGGSFTLTLTADATIVAADDDEPTDPDTAQIISLGEQVTGELVANVGAQYVFNAQAGDIVSLAAYPDDLDSGLDLTLELYTEAGDLLTLDDDGGWRLSPILVGVELPESGTYRVVVQSFDGQTTGTFLLAVVPGDGVLAPNGAFAQPLPLIDSVATVTGSDAVLYSFEGIANDPLVTNATIDLFTADSAVDITVAPEEAYPLPATTTYYILARSDAEIRIGEPEPLAVITSAGEVAAGLPAQGTLAENETQVWVFTPILAGEYRFVLTSQDDAKIYDPYLTVRDVAGNILAEDDDSGGEFDAEIASLTLASGQTVRVEVSGFAGQSGGDYVLGVVAEAVEAPESVSGGGVLIGQPIGNTINVAGQDVKFTLVVDEKTTYNLAVDGLKLPTIDVYDSENNLLTRGIGSIKDLTLEAGTYTLQVYDRLNLTGAFTLIVTETE